eukprot:TRINITY_DN21181_c0_g1_i1.p1 TRINITY_DN21181_c0_g1~~TRINITY_DN21181_c0_g1_i1.p1  ORF type:complete len:121 (+),score=14.47 TRINITY_DN21181_c0_g1_i1:67-429(+)
MKKSPEAISTVVASWKEHTLTKSISAPNQKAYNNSITITLSKSYDILTVLGFVCIGHQILPQESTAGHVHKSPKACYNRCNCLSEETKLLERRLFFVACKRGLRQFLLSFWRLTTHRFPG